MDTLNITTTYGSKTSQSTLTATEWNALMSTLQGKINELVSSENSSSSASDDFYVNGVKTTPVNGVITLAAASEYILEGTLHGQVLIECGLTAPTDNTNIRLNGVNIVTDLNSGIKYNTPEVNTGFKDLVVTLEKDSVNTIVCTTVAAVADNQEACVYSMNNMVIQGVGYLSCMNKGGHCVRATELRLTGIHFYGESTHDLIHAGRIMNIDCGTYMSNKCKDMFGTGTGGNIYFYHGNIYAMNVTENIFDAKTHVYNFSNDTIANAIKNTTVAEASWSANPILTASDYYINNSIASYVRCYDFVNDAANLVTIKGTTYTDITVDETTGKYLPTSPYVEVSGIITAPIQFTVATLDTFVDPDCEVVMLNAYLNNSTVAAPTILYSANSSEKGKVKIKSSADTINCIINTAVDQTLLLDLDGIKSENNLGIEMKNNSHLVIYSQKQDGADGGQLKITDSKGTLIITNCGQRGLKGNAIVIGPACEISSSVITTYYTDPADTENYRTMNGAVVVVDNCKLVTVGPCILPDATTTGFSDIYGRNGSSYSKGEFGTKSNELKGVLICGSLAARNKVEMDNARNLYYNKLVVGPAIAKRGETLEQYVALPINQAPIIKS